jgi:hypothetical protein
MDETENDYCYTEEIKIYGGCKISRILKAHCTKCF